MSYVLAGVSSVTAIGYVIARASRPTAVAVGISAAVTIALNAALVPFFGIVGSAIATLLGQAVQPAILMKGAKKAHYIPFPWIRGTAIIAWAMLLVGAGETIVPSALTISGAAIRLILLVTMIVVASLLAGLRPATVKTQFARLRLP